MRRIHHEIENTFSIQTSNRYSKLKCHDITNRIDSILMFKLNPRKKLPERENRGL